jgi:hypothetical protein
MQLERCDQINDESLEKYAMGSLPEAMIAELDEHLLLCCPCQEKLNEIDSYVDARRIAAARLDREDESRRHLFTQLSQVMTIHRLSWAIIVITLVFGGIAIYVSGRSPQAAQPFAVVLGANRSLDTQRAPPGRPIELSLDVTGVRSYPSYKVELVDAMGRLQSESNAKGTQGRVTTSLSGHLRCGSYIIQLYAPSRELLREYGLKIE